MFGEFKVHAGDFVTGSSHQFVGGASSGTFIMRVEGKFLREKIQASEVEEVCVASEENVKRIGGTVGWGIAGAALLGPVGLLAGLILGGRKKEVTFICKFKDGRKFLGTAPQKVYTQIQAALF